MTNKLTDETPDHINFLLGFILWIGFPIVGLIPAFAVEEDLRRLNMKEVKESNYVTEKRLLQHTDSEKIEFYKTHKIIANP
jgi:hypothetical protein